MVRAEEVEAEREVVESPNPRYAITVRRRITPHVNALNLKLATSAVKQVTSPKSAPALLKKRASRSLNKSKLPLAKHLRAACPQREKQRSPRC